MARDRDPRRARGQVPKARVATGATPATEWGHLGASSRHIPIQTEARLQVRIRAFMTDMTMGTVEGARPDPRRLTNLLLRRGA